MPLMLPGVICSPSPYPGGSDGKASAYNLGDLGSVPGLGRSSGEGNGNPLQYPTWKIPWTANLVGYSPWGLKESDTTATSLFHFHQEAL